MSWFSEGYDVVEKESQRIEEAMNKNFVPNFILKEDEEAKIIFLTTEPVNFYEHYLKAQNRYFTCSQNDCPLCEMGNKASYRGAYLVLDTRYEEWVDKKTNEKKSRQNTIKVMKHGVKALKQIKKQHAKRGLDKFAWEIARTGSGTDTSYGFIPEDLDEVMDGVKMPTADEIAEAKKAMLENLAPKDRQFILDVLAGRTPSNNGGQATPPQQTNTTPQGGFSSDVGDDDSDGGVLRFI